MRLPRNAHCSHPRLSQVGQIDRRLVSCPRGVRLLQQRTSVASSHTVALSLLPLLKLNNPFQAAPESPSTLLITQVVFMFPSLNTWIDVFVLLVKVRGIWRPWLFPSMRSWGALQAMLLHLIHLLDLLDGDGGRDFVGFHPSNCSRLFHAHVVFSRPKTNAKPYQYYHGCYCYYGYHYRFIVVMILWWSL